MVEGKNVDQNIIDEFKKHKDEMQLFPDKLKNFVFKYIENHDYENILLKQWEKAYRKERFDEGIYFEGKSVILGKRTYISKMFIDWMDELLSGAIPYAYEKELIKFLIRIRSDLN